MNAVASEPAANAELLQCVGLDVQVATRTLVHNLSFAVLRGSVTCVLGRNGAGKTLTMHTFAGLRAPAKGVVRIDQQELTQWPRRALARRVGLLTQMTEDPFPSTVLETVLVGRHPHIDFWRWEDEGDRAIARDALVAVGLGEFESRDIATLSGGERRRVAIATMLTQNPDLLLLDEPINHLDPHQQIGVLRLLRAKAAANHAVLMSLHDAGLAARFCDHALLLFGDGEWLFGSCAEVLNEATIARLYGVQVREIFWEGGRTFVAV